MRTEEKRKKRKTNSQRQNGLGTVVVVGTKSKKETLCSFVLAEQKLNFFYLSAGVHTYIRTQTDDDVGIV